MGVAKVVPLVAGALSRLAEVKVIFAVAVGGSDVSDGMGIAEVGPGGDSRRTPRLTTPLPGRRYCSPDLRPN